MGRIAVIGAGVVGLTVAHELAVAGHRVEVVAGADHAGSVSSVAAAIWFPHAVDSSARVLASARTTGERLAALAADPATGVRMRTGTVLARRPDPDLSWTSAVAAHRPATASEVPEGASGVVVTLPVAVTDVYLGWLRARVEGLGVGFRTAGLVEPEDVGAGFDAVVVAAGLGSGALLGDPQVHPIRGQVVRLANPGLTRWVTDDDNPGGLTYVVPRDGDVVCGGTGDVGEWGTEPDPEVEAAILRRATALVPELAGCPVVSRAVGLRPARPRVRLEVVDGRGLPVVACYGHGGAGFTLSWGEAAEVVRVVGGLGV
ncbi:MULTISPECIES: FAD-dependent oxidoreductase [Actinosynnema]|uniref:FAD-dependent oxidoreductase n=1 Tax=Actinosynnema TaxID=40566 RepID=UPI0026467FF5|nr:FAD-dependent oxidoreductase [Actinosynnema pretiosum]MCP2095059.1 D-amino-acid:oxygen oxidoreductase (deaminating) (EC 1.4.3.3) [Actinosynnema pretiosum]